MKMFYGNRGVFFLVSSLTLALLGYTFSWGILDLANAWNGKEYGHSYFLPFLALLMALHRLSLNPLPSSNSWAGVGLVFFGVALLLIGELSAFRQLAHYGFYFSIVGFFLTYFGNKIIMRVFPAFILLLFAIPLPVQFNNNLSLELKLISSSLGAIFLGLFNVPVFQDGNIIDLGSYKLQVVDACSGLRYLFPLMSFGFLVSYLLKAAWWKRGVVFLSTIPITILLNAVRIAIIGFTVDQWGPKMAEGLLHEFEGWVVFLLCLIVLWGETVFVLKTEKGSSFDLDFFTLPKGPFLTSLPKISVQGWVLLALVLMSASIIGTGLVMERAQNIPQHKNLSLFPLSLADWQGQTQQLDAEVVKSLELSDYLNINYHVADKLEFINLYVAYYDVQKIGSAIHSPATCVPGGGWEIESISEKGLNLSGDASALQAVTRMIIRKGIDKQVVYYWFNQRGRNLPDRLAVKKYLLLDSIMYGRTDGALVRVITSIGQGDTAETAEKRLESFLTEAVPQISSFLPKGEE